MSELKKLPLIFPLVILCTGPVPKLFPQGSSMVEITNASSFGITYGTMHSAFERDLKFEDGVQMVVDAAVELMVGSVEEAKRLSMDPAGFVNSVLDGVERSIHENSKRVGLQAREEKILYDAVMSALRLQINLLGAGSVVTTTQDPPKEVKPPVEPPKPPEVVEPEKPVEPPKKEPRVASPRRTDGYYINTFSHVGFASSGNLAVPDGKVIHLDPGTGWGYGLSVGLRTSERVRLELEGSWKGSSAKAKEQGSRDLEISYYSLMVNAYYDYPLPFINNLDVFGGAGLGWSVANLSGDVLNHSVFGNIPETGDLVLAYQFMAGLSYRFTDRISAALSYRLFNTATYNHYNPAVIHMIELALKVDL